MTIIRKHDRSHVSSVHFNIGFHVIMNLYCIAYLNLFGSNEGMHYIPCWNILAREFIPMHENIEFASKNVFQS